MPNNPFDLAAVLAEAKGNEESIQSDDARMKKLAIVIYNTACGMFEGEPYDPGQAVAYIRGIQGLMFDEWEKTGGYYVKTCQDGDTAAYVRDRLDSLVRIYADSVTSYKPIEVVRLGSEFQARAVRVMVGTMDGLKEALGL